MSILDLSSHRVDLRHRAKLVDWLLEITINYDFGFATLFTAVEVLDRFIEGLKTPIKMEDL